MSYHAPKHPLRIFGLSVFISIAAVATGYFYGGLTAAALVLLLVVFEVSLSFDNAIINARIVEKLSPFWQKLFLTVGVILAVFFMRLLFPLLIVGATTGLNPFEAFGLAMEKGDPETPGTYGYIIEAAHPQIAAFGGMFLLMLFLDFILNPDRDIYWLRWIEAPLAKLGKLNLAPVILGLITLLIIGALAIDHGGIDALIAGTVGMVTYLVVNGLGNYFENKLEEDEKKEEQNHAISAAAKLTGKAAFASFLYLEVLDASFSLDGVVGALALSTDPIIIALGLGAGAMFVRSMTIYLVNKGTLNDYVYLDHGAHYAIGSLAVLLVASIALPIPEIVTGLIGVVIIIASLVASVLRNKRLADAGDTEDFTTLAKAHNLD